MPFYVAKSRALFLDVLALLVGMANVVLARRKVVALFCPPVPEGNRGDQALLAAVVDSLRDKGYKRIDLVQTSYHPIVSIKPDNIIRILPGHRTVFESPQCFKDQIRYVLYLLGKRDVILVGCDVLDEGYSAPRSQGSLYAMYLAGRTAKNARIIGFSVNATSSPALFERFRKVVARGVKLFARDAVTHDRLMKGGVPQAQLVGDLAFLLKPARVEDLEDSTLRAFIQEHKGKLVGLNFTDGVMGKGPEKEALFDSVAQACQTLAQEKGYRFVCIVHDDQGGVEYLRELHERIESHQPGIAKVTLPMPPASHLKCIAGQCLQVFSCRLHLAIATLGMGRPVTGFPYQGKFEGQFGHFGLGSENLYPPAQLQRTPEAITQLMRDRLAQSETLASQVQAKLPDVLAMSRKNFEGL